MTLTAKNLRLWLVAQAAIEELVGTRIHAVRLPQPAELPAFAIRMVSMVPVTSTQGFSGLRTMRYQLDIYAEEFDELEPVSEAIFDALEGFAGMMEDTHVTRAHLLACRDFDEDDVKEFHRVMDWEIVEERHL